MIHDCDEGWTHSDYGSWPCATCKPDMYRDWIHGTQGATQ